MSAEAGEGITFSVPPFAPSGLCAFPEGSSCRGGEVAAEGEENQLPPPPPGSFWNVESTAASGTGCPAATSGSSTTRYRGNSGGAGGRRTTVAYVINEASQGQLVVAESEALQSLREACEKVGAALETLHFGKLDFGETTVLDRFYNAGACVTPSLSSTVRGRVSPGRYRGINVFLGKKKKKKKKILGSGRASCLFTSCCTLGEGAALRDFSRSPLLGESGCWSQSLCVSVPETDGLTHRPALEPWGSCGPHKELLFFSTTRYLS